MPTSRDLAIFVPMTTTTDRQTDYFTPYACMQGVITSSGYPIIFDDEMMMVLFLIVSLNKKLILPTLRLDALVLLGAMVMWRCLVK